MPATAENSQDFRAEKKKNNQVFPGQEALKREQMSFSIYALLSYISIKLKNSKMLYYLMLIVNQFK